jgi:hypothetical protein
MILGFKFEWKKVFISNATHRLAAQPLKQSTDYVPNKRQPKA